MDAELIADLFRGEIATCRDRRIKELSPAVRLPDPPVSVVHRSDSSATTANFTAFLTDRLRRAHPHPRGGPARRRRRERPRPVRLPSPRTVATAAEDMAGPGQSAASRLNYTPVPATSASPSPPGAVGQSRFKPDLVVRHSRRVRPGGAGHGSHEFHIYAAEWTPEYVAIFVDHQLVKLVEQSPAYPMQFMLGIYEFPDEGQTPHPAHPYPKELTVDYVRGYRRTTRALDPRLDTRRQGVDPAS
jgi:Glycosyl hydrolases family 16